MNKVCLAAFKRIILKHKSLDETKKTGMIPVFFFWQRYKDSNLK